MMRWTKRLLALVFIILLAPACSFEDNTTVEALVQVNSLLNMNLSSIVVSPEASVKVQTVTINVTIDNLGSANLTNVYIYLEIIDPANNTADSVYLDNSTNNYTIAAGDSLVLQHSWGNNDCPGGCPAGTYIIDATAYADSVSPESLNKTFTVSNPPPGPPPAQPSGGTGTGLPVLTPPVICISDIAVSPQSIGLRGRVPLTGFEVVTVENRGTCEENLTISLDKELRSVVRVSRSSLGILENSSAIFSVAIETSEPGLYKGRIELWGGDVLLKWIPVEVIALSRSGRMMDLEVEIDPTLKIVEIGDAVEGKITIVNLGTSESEDVELTLTISQIGGAPISSLTERFSVREYVVLTRSMKAPGVAGDYSLSVAVKYGDKVVRASESFTVEPKKKKEAATPFSAIATAVGAAGQIVGGVVTLENVKQAGAALLSLLLLVGIPVGSVLLTLRYLRKKSGRRTAVENVSILRAARKSLAPKKRRSIVDLWKNRKTAKLGDGGDRKKSVSRLWKEGKI